MKIVHLNFTFRQGGIPALLVDITNDQAKTEQVSIIVINNQVHEEMLAEVPPSVKIYLIKRPVGSRNPLYALKINYLLWCLKPDVIHCHGENCIKHLLPLFRKKAVLTVHDTLIKNSLHAKYRKVFAISKAVQQDVLTRYGVHSEVVYNGINTVNIKIKKNMQKQGIFRVLQIGRLVTHIKGQHLSIEALRILVHEYKIVNLHFDFIGWGEDYEQLDQMVKEYHLENYVTFLGLKDRLYIYSHLCDYDLMIHPSLFEGFGLNIVEAMAARVLVLVSDTDGPIEVIGKGEFGYFFKTGDVNDLTEKLLEIMNNNNNIDIQSRFLEAAYTHVINNFDIHATAKGYINGYKK